MLWPALTTQLGDTWGDYRQALATNAGCLSTLGHTVYDVGELFRFEVRAVLGMNPQTVLAGRVVERLLYRDEKTGHLCTTPDEIPFYRAQRRIVLAHNGVIDPTRIEEYLAAVAIALRGQRSVDPVVRALAAHVGDDNWREVSRLAIGYLGIVQQRDEAAGAALGELIQAAAPLGGQGIEMADAAVEIPAFPRVPVVFALWEASDEFAPEGTVMFDDSLPTYLETEDAIIVCEEIFGALKEHV